MVLVALGDGLYRHRPHLLRLGVASSLARFVVRLCRSCQYLIRYDPPHGCVGNPPRGPSSSQADATGPGRGRRKAAVHNRQDRAWASRSKPDDASTASASGRFRPPAPACPTRRARRAADRRHACAVPRGASRHARGAGRGICRRAGFACRAIRVFRGRPPSVHGRSSVSSSNIKSSTSSSGASALASGAHRETPTTSTSAQPRRGRTNAGWPRRSPSSELGSVLPDSRSRGSPRQAAGMNGALTRWSRLR